MKLFYIFFQIYRNYTGAFALYSSSRLVKRETSGIHDIVGQKLRSHCKKLIVGIIGSCQREYSIDNIIYLADIHGLCLADNLHDYFSLTLSTLEVITCSITDTAVGSCLYTVQCLKSGLCQRSSLSRR